MKQLVLKIKSGDRSAFKTLFEHFQNSLYNFLIYKTGDSDLSEDILQETLLKVWQKRDRLDESLSIKSYLFTMANNSAMNYFRHQKVIYAHQAQYQFEDEDRSPEDIFRTKEFYDQVLQAIENLPEKTRITFMMSRFEDLSYKEIAERTDVSIKTVESHIGGPRGERASCRRPCRRRYPTGRACHCRRVPDRRDAAPPSRRHPAR